MGSQRPAQNGFGYYGLEPEFHGCAESRRQRWTSTQAGKALLPHLTIVPSIRVQKEDTDANFNGFETLADNTPAPFSGNSNEGILDVRERLDVTYNGFTNWVLYARGEVTEGDGHLQENGGTIPINDIGVPTIQRYTDDGRFFQKYSLGARWAYSLAPHDS